MRASSFLVVMVLSAMSACQCGGPSPVVDGGLDSEPRDGGTGGGAATGGGGGGAPFAVDDAGVLLCRSLGATCTAAAECCSRSCEGGLCGGPSSGGACDPAAAPCTAASACCTARCEPVPNSTQRACLPACFGDGVACTRALECCSLGCNNGLCGGAICKVSNDDCTANVECCSHRCVGGQCEVNVQNCRPTGETCNSGGSTTCCGVCDKNAQPRPRCVFGDDACRGTGAACQADGGAGGCCRGTCVNVLCATPCAVPGAACSATSPCCAGSCLNGTCAQATLDAGVATFNDGGTCFAIGTRCTSAGECCTQVCFGGFCEPGIN